MRARRRGEAPDRLACLHGGGAGPSTRMLEGDGRQLRQFCPPPNPLTHHPDCRCLQPPAGHHLFRWGILQSTGIFCLSVSGHSTLPALRSAMACPQRFPTALKLAFTVLLTVYALVAGTGYWCARVAWDGAACVRRGHWRWVVQRAASPQPAEALPRLFMLALCRPTSARPSGPPSSHPHLPSLLQTTVGTLAARPPPSSPLTCRCTPSTLATLTG